MSGVHDSVQTQTHSLVLVLIYVCEIVRAQVERVLVAVVCASLIATMCLCIHLCAPLV